MSKLIEKLKDPESEITIQDIAEAVGQDLEGICAAIRALPIPPDEQEYMANQFLWVKISEAFANGNYPAYANSNAKYWPYAWGVFKDEKDPSGFGFSGTGTDYASSFTVVGARQLFNERWLSTQAIRRFPHIYKIAVIKGKGNQQ